MATLQIMSLEQIYSVNPSAVFYALSYVAKQNSGLTACAVPDTTIYFDTSGNTTLPSPPVFAPGTTIDCRCLTFFANLFAGIYQQITTVQQSSVNLIQSVSVDTANINIYSPGGISNVNITNNQTTNTTVTLVNISDPSTQNSIANISLQAMQSIVAQARASTVFNDPVSQQIVQVYANYLQTLPTPAPASSLNSPCVSKDLSIVALNTANMITATSGNSYNLEITNSNWKQLNITIDQDTAQDLMLQNIVNGITFGFADQALGARLNAIMASIQSQCPLTSAAPAAATSGNGWLLTILLPVLAAVVVIAVILIVVFVPKK
jgi:hypothetical protein